MKDEIIRLQKEVQRLKQNNAKYNQSFEYYRQNNKNKNHHFNASVEDPISERNPKSYSFINNANDLVFNSALFYKHNYQSPFLRKPPFKQGMFSYKNSLNSSYINNSSMISNKLNRTSQNASLLSPNLRLKNSDDIEEPNIETNGSQLNKISSSSSLNLNKYKISVRTESNVDGNGGLSGRKNPSKSINMSMDSNQVRSKKSYNASNNNTDIFKISPIFSAHNQRFTLYSPPIFMNDSGTASNKKLIDNQKNINNNININQNIISNGNIIIENEPLSLGSFSRINSNIQGIPISNNNINNNNSNINNNVGNIILNNNLTNNNTSNFFINNNSNSNSNNTSNNIHKVPHKIKKESKTLFQNKPTCIRESRRMIIEYIKILPKDNLKIDKILEENNISPTVLNQEVIDNYSSNFLSNYKSSKFKMDSPDLLSLNTDIIKKQVPYHEIQPPIKTIKKFLKDMNDDYKISHFKFMSIPRVMDMTFNNIKKKYVFILCPNKLAYLKGIESYIFKWMEKNGGKYIGGFDLVKINFCVISSTNPMNFIIETYDGKVNRNYEIETSSFENCSKYVKALNYLSQLEKCKVFHNKNILNKI